MKTLLPLVLTCCIAFTGCDHEIAVRTVEYEVSSLPASSLKVSYCVPGKPDTIGIFGNGWRTSYVVGANQEYKARLSAAYNGQNVSVTLKIFVDGKLVKDRTAELNNVNHIVQTIDQTIK